MSIGSYRGSLTLILILILILTLTLTLIPIPILILTIIDYMYMYRQLLGECDMEVYSQDERDMGAVPEGSG